MYFLFLQKMRKIIWRRVQQVSAHVMFVQKQVSGYQAPWHLQLDYWQRLPFQLSLTSRQASYCLQQTPDIWVPSTNNLVFTKLILINKYGLEMDRPLLRYLYAFLISGNPDNRQNGVWESRDMLCPKQTKNSVRSVPIAARLSLFIKPNAHLEIDEPECQTVRIQTQIVGSSKVSTATIQTYIHQTSLMMLGAICVAQFCRFCYPSLNHLQVNLSLGALGWLVGCDCLDNGRLWFRGLGVSDLSIGCLQSLGSLGTGHSGSFGCLVDSDFNGNMTKA